MPKPSEFFPYHYRVVDIDLSAGLDNVEYEYGGGAIHYVKGSWPVYVRFEHFSKDKIPLFPGMSIEIPFKRFYLSSDAHDEIITLHIYDPAGMIRGHNSVNVNELIHDRSKWHETDKEHAFMGRVGFTNTSGNYSSFQIWNPNNSGVVCILENFVPRWVATGTYGITNTTSPLANKSSSYLNKKLGKASPKCELRYEELTSYPMALDELVMHPVYTHNFLLGQKLIIEANNGLQFTCTSTTANWRGFSFEWLEIPIT